MSVPTIDVAAGSAKLLAVALAVAGVLSAPAAWAAADVFVLSEKGVNLGISSTSGKIDDL